MRCEARRAVNIPIHVHARPLAAGESAHFPGGGRGLYSSNGPSDREGVPAARRAVPRAVVGSWPPPTQQCPIDDARSQLGDIQALHTAVDRLRAGGVVAFPTETVYGLGADALNEAAVERVFKLKGRPPTNPLIVHVSGPEMARTLVAEGAWSGDADRLARALWPGPLTLVLPRASCVPRAVTAGGDTVALRAPNHPMAMALLMLFGGPLVGPSANLSGRVSPTRAAHVREAFDEDEVMTLDGGPCAVGIESTVLSLAGVQPLILRPGVVGPEAIAEVLGREVRVRDRAPVEPGAMPSPGLLAVHYAPHTPTSVADAADIDDLLEDATEDARHVVVLSHSLACEVTPPHDLIQMPATPGEYAAALYDALRLADDRAADQIIVSKPPTTAESASDAAVWRAVADRLARASSAGSTPRH